jgi:hypothetical protein
MVFLKKILCDLKSPGEDTSPSYVLFREGAGCGVMSQNV